LGVVIHEAEAGICFRCQYELEEDSVVFTDIRVLDHEYRAQGPNLASVLGSLFYYRRQEDDTAIGEQFLSVVARDINEQTAA